MKETLITLLLFISLLIAGCAEIPKTMDAPRNTMSQSTVEHGMTLYNCLGYDNSRWLEIEDRFIEDELEKMPYEYEIYDSSELSEDILLNRNGKIIVERCIGFVTNKTTGDGRLLNPYDKRFDYIAYRSVTNQKYYDGTVFLSYMIYNPGNNDTDDITERHDFVLCREWED